MPKQITRPSEYPQAVLQQIERLGQNIAIARKRRGETQGQWAQRLGVSQPTMARIERGDPAVAMVSYMMCMWLVDPAVAVAELVSPLRDHAALEREVTRVRGPRPASPGPTERKRERTTAPAATTARLARASASPVPAAMRAASDTAAGLAALLNQGSTKARP